MAAASLSRLIMPAHRHDDNRAVAAGVAVNLKCHAALVAAQPPLVPAHGQDGAGRVVGCRVQSTLPAVLLP